MLKNQQLLDLGRQSRGKTGRGNVTPLAVAPPEARQLQLKIQTVMRLVEAFSPLGRPVAGPDDVPSPRPAPEDRSSDEP